MELVAIQEQSQRWLSSPGFQRTKSWRQHALAGKERRAKQGGSGCGSTGTRQPLTERKCIILFSKTRAKAGPGLGR